MTTAVAADKGRCAPHRHDRRCVRERVALSPDGRAYATVTSAGALLRIHPASPTPEVFLPPGSLPDPNGIAVTSDGRYALVAGWHGIIRVDLETRETMRLRQPSNVASGCTDGLYLSAPNEVVGVQNCVHDTGRILRFRMTPQLDSIVSAEVLESYNPLFEGITTAAIAGDSLYFVANTQLRKHALGGSPAPVFNPLRVLRVSLSSRRGP